MRGRGSKIVCFCPCLWYKNRPSRGGGVKKWQNYVLIVVECPLIWVWKFLIEIQLTKADQKRTGGGNCQLGDLYKKNNNCLFQSLEEKQGYFERYFIPVSIFLTYRIYFPVLSMFEQPFSFFVLHVRHEKPYLPQIEICILVLSIFDEALNKSSGYSSGANTIWG